MEIRYKNIPLAIVFDNEKSEPKRKSKTSFFVESIFNKAEKLNEKGISGFSIKKKDFKGLSFWSANDFDKVKTIYIDKKTHNIYLPKNVSGHKEENVIKENLNLSKSRAGSKSDDIIEVRFVEVEKIESSEERDLLSKTEGCWVCIQSREDDFGGNIYTFKIKSGYNEISPKGLDDDVLDKMIDLEWDSFPAVQQGALDLMYIFHDMKERLSVDEVVRRKSIFLSESYGKDPEAWEGPVKNNLLRYSQYGQYFYSLGYQLRQQGEDVYLELPDDKALNARWKKLQELDPTLPNFKVILSKGVAGEPEFIEAFLNGVVVLSSEKEFVHDHTLHVMKLILRILLSHQIDKDQGDEPGTYINDINTEMHDVIETLYSEVCDYDKNLKESGDTSVIKQDHVKHNLVLLGIIIDMFTSLEDPDASWKFINETANGTAVENILAHPKWAKYLNERFGAGSGWLLANSWEQIQDAG